MTQRALKEHSESNQRARAIRLHLVKCVSILYIGNHNLITQTNSTSSIKEALTAGTKP